MFSQERRWETRFTVSSWKVMHVAKSNMNFTRWWALAWLLKLGEKTGALPWTCCEDATRGSAAG